ncbi:hypothetical protein SETIT_9G256400v2 [Setaria italica]|uniref:Uncharacterized protein n=1 Tax=Setaria italica TaxID=4555 RepID=A0A368SKR8_SETIT|nr:hypothetical protein SETIT_9G256400v2 [Setaria italica]
MASWPLIRCTSSLAWPLPARPCRRCRTSSRRAGCHHGLHVPRRSQLHGLLTPRRTCSPLADAQKLHLLQPLPPTATWPPQTTSQDARLLLHCFLPSTQIQPGRHRIRPCSCRIWPALTSTARAIAGDRHQHRRQRKLLRREERRGLAAAVLALAWASSQVLHRRREGGKEGWGSSAAAQVSALVAPDRSDAVASVQFPERLF